MTVLCDICRCTFMEKLLCDQKPAEAPAAAAPKQPVKPLVRVSPEGHEFGSTVLDDSGNLWSLHPMGWVVKLTGTGSGFPRPWPHVVEFYGAKAQDVQPPQPISAG